MPTPNDVPEAGDSYSVERTFTRDGVRQFADVSGDTQSRHDPDADGPVLVHDLLTATLPTQIGGDLEVLARTMDFEFRRPVFAGDTVRCTWTTDAVEERTDRHVIEASVVCDRIDEDDGEPVLTGTVEGIIWNDDAEAAGDD